MRLCVRSMCDCAIVRYAIDVRSMCDRCAIGVRSMCDRYAIDMRSICDRCPIGTQFARGHSSFQVIGIAVVAAMLLAVITSCLPSQRMLSSTRVGGRSAS